MDISDTSSTLSSSESNEYHEHNIWNPMLELLCHKHFGVYMEAPFDEEDTVDSHFLVTLHWTSCATRNGWEGISLVVGPDIPSKTGNDRA